MSDSYDCADDVKRHKELVEFFLEEVVVKELSYRAAIHDASKLTPEEKVIFDKWTPVLRECEFGSYAYEQALKMMGEGLKLHYRNNKHHPEHFERGVCDMTLVDLIEMVCDWIAIADRKGEELNLQYLAQRFQLHGQLYEVVLNTVYFLKRYKRG